MNEKTSAKELIFKRILDEQKQFVFYGVKNIGLFGSFVRGDQTPLEKWGRPFYFYIFAIFTLFLRSGN